jgi:hypothetical protein
MQDDGSSELFGQLIAAAQNPDPEELQRFLVAHKAQLDHFRD